MYIPLSGTGAEFFPPAARESQVLVRSPYLLSTPSFFDRPLAAVHRSHRQHVRPNREQEEVRKVDGAPEAPEESKTPDGPAS